MRRPPRCYDHRERAEFPVLCATCQRIRVEQRIVTKTIDALLKAGYALYVDGQGDDNRPEQPSTSYTDVRAEVQETDDDYLMVFKPDAANREPQHVGYTCIGYVRFVYGNDGYDVISDYSCNLEDRLKPINAFADTLSV